jgi:hypothetical protein
VVDLMAEFASPVAAAVIGRRRRTFANCSGEPGSNQTEQRGDLKMKRTNGKFAWRFLAALAALLTWAASAAAQTVVVGTGNPDVDVPAVQAAVDQGGEVILRGHFSFDRPPTVPMALGGFATVLVSRAVAISGAWEEHDDDASIERGTTPFYVKAPGASVEIRRLRFIHPTGDAINVYAASGLVIASCKIDGVDPDVGGAGGIDIGTTNDVPTPTKPGKPENISGTLLVVNNDIDVGGTAPQLTTGIRVFSVGVPGAEVEVYVSRNTIRNTTEPAINFRRIVGRAYIERNVITTGSVVGGPTDRAQAIRVANIGSYLIAHNSIDCGWLSTNAEGIGVFSQFAAWPMEGAIVVDNDVNMSVPKGTVFDNFSAGIGVYGFAQGNVVLGNRIRGRARAALSIPVFPLPPQAPAVPTNNAFVLSRFDDFEPSVADISVGAGAMNTLIVGRDTVEDHGVGTIIVPLPPLGSRQELRE